MPKSIFTVNRHGATVNSRNPQKEISVIHDNKTGILPDALTAALQSAAGTDAQNPCEMFQEFMAELVLSGLPQRRADKTRPVGRPRHARQNMADPHPSPLL